MCSRNIDDYIVTDNFMVIDDFIVTDYFMVTDDFIITDDTYSNEVAF